MLYTAKGTAALGGPCRERACAVTRVDRGVYAITENLPIVLQATEEVMVEATATATKPASSTAEDTLKEKSRDANVVSGEAERTPTDGFHLVIDALMLNGINTIYGVP